MESNSTTMPVIDWAEEIRPELLAEFLHPCAKDYLKPGVSNVAKERLERLLAGEVALNNFPPEESELNLRSFDWESGHDNRNWWWQLQQLSMLDWLRGCWDICDDEERLRFFGFLKAALFRWKEVAFENENSPLVWHDHATCLRLRHVIFWLTFVGMEKPDYLSASDIQRVLDLIKSHVFFLSDEENYTRHTNHGFDQVFVLYQLCLLWKDVGYLKAVHAVAYKNLLDEIDYAFTSQGVHKENSPGYQKFMIGRIVAVNEIDLLFKAKANQHLNDLERKASQFLKALALPNSTLPMIGDTQGGEKVRYHKPRPGFQIMDYTASGYLIVRGLDIKSRPFHLIVKSSHYSRYHRHDDDLSIHLYFNGEILLGDAGLYSHNEKENIRRFVRSPLAHNTVYMKGKAAIRLDTDLRSAPSLSLDAPYLVRGKTFAYGDRLERQVDFSKIHIGELVIRDRVVTRLEEEQTVDVNFFVPDRVEYNVEDNAFFLKTRNNELRIKPRNEPSEVEFVSGVEEDGVAVVSKTINVWEPASRLTYSYKGSKNRYYVHKISVR